MIVADKDHVDRRQMIECDAGRSASSRTRKRQRAGALRPDRIEEDIQAGDLNKETRVTDKRDAARTCLQSCWGPVLGGLRRHVSQAAIEARRPGRGPRPGCPDKRSVCRRSDRLAAPGSRRCSVQMRASARRSRREPQILQRHCGAMALSGSYRDDARATFAPMGGRTGELGLRLPHRGQPFVHGDPGRVAQLGPGLAGADGEWLADKA